MEKIKSITIEHENEEIKIDVSLFLGEESFKIAYLLQQTLIPALSNVFGVFSGSTNISDLMKKELDFSFIKNGISEIFKNLGNEKEAYSLIKRLVSGVVVYGGSRIYRLNSDTDFNEFFMGRMELVYLIVYEVLKINYPFFLKKINSLSSIMRKIDITSLQKENQNEPGEDLEGSQVLTEKPKPHGHSGASCLAAVLDA